MMYANDDFTVFCNVQQGEFQIPITEEEMELKLQENLEKNKIENLLKDEQITKEDFLDIVKSQVKNFFLEKFKETDNILIEKQKKEYLGMWNNDDDVEFNKKMQEYKENLVKYQEIKENLESYKNNKKRLIEYYNNVIISLLGETK